MFSTQGQEAFLEGHQVAFEVLGGVPVDRIRYDNLKSAVSRVLFGRSRTESARWVSFRSHYGVDAFYLLWRCSSRTRRCCCFSFCSDR